MIGIVKTRHNALTRLATGQAPRYEVEDTRNITPGYRYRIREVWPDGAHTSEDLFSFFGDDRFALDAECQRLNTQAVTA